MKPLFLRVAAIVSPLFAAMLLTAPAQAAPFAVAPPEPTQTFVNQDTTFHSDLTDGGAVIDHCNLSVDGVSHGAMTVFTGPGGKSAFLETSISAAGTRTVRVTCYDASESNSSYNETAVTVFNDTAAPGVGAFTLTPGSPVAGTSVTIQTNYDDTDFGSGIDNCSLYVDGAFISLMGLSGGSGSTAGSATRDYTFGTAGSYAVEVKCTDFSGNVGTRSETVSVTAPPDTADPVVSAITPSSATAGVAVNVQATVSDNIGVTSCDLEVNGVNQGGMTVASGLATKALSFTIIGDNAVKVTCFDAAGNAGTRSALINVSDAAASDTAAPVIGTVLPASATQSVATNIVAEVTDNVGVSSCTLTVNGVLAGAMSVAGIPSGSTAERLHSFTVSGNNTIRIDCQDAAGNVGSRTTTVNVSGSVSPTPYANRLVKLACPAGFVDVNHPCKAVYYVGSDGKRHAFPNERVYFTWYANFDGILELDGGTMATIVLGSNVNYRPGMRMVKFTTVNKVYAVGRYGQLRWVTSEDVARTLYGTDWNRKIDDINDAFFTDYTFGADITSASSYNPTVEAATATNIDANLR